jgi:hypothetical protein
MGLDHFPDRVCVSIEGVAREWGVVVDPGSNRATASKGDAGASRPGTESPSSDEPLINAV